MFTGCSAGALGVFFHADHVYELVSQMKVKYYKLNINNINNIKGIYRHNSKTMKRQLDDNYNYNLTSGVGDIDYDSDLNDATTSVAIDFNYMSMPDAGYFMQVGAYIMMMEFNYKIGNLTMSLNQNCVNYYKSRNNTIQCMFAVNIAPFIETKILSLQSQFDSNQLAYLNSNNLTTINQYGQNLTKYYIDRFIDTGNGNHFGWLVSCYEHCIFSYQMWKQIQIDGYTVAQVQMNAWYNSNTAMKFLFQNYSYPCNDCCN